MAQWLVVIRGTSVNIGKGALRKCSNYMTGQGQCALQNNVVSGHSIAVILGTWTAMPLLGQLLPLCGPLHLHSGSPLTPILSSRIGGGYGRRTDGHASAPDHAPG